MLSGLARIIAAIVAFVYVLYVPIFALDLLFKVDGWPYGQRDRSQILWNLFAIAYLLGVTALGVVYAIRPFRYGFPILIVVSLGVWTYAGFQRRQALRDDPIARQHAARVVDRYLDGGPEGEDHEGLRIQVAGDKWRRWHLNTALLEAADSLDDDASLERVVTALGEVGRGRRVERYLMDLVEETGGDAERARLNAAARAAYESVKGGDPQRKIP